MSPDAVHHQDNSIILSDSNLLKTHTIILDQGDPEEKRQEILDYFHKTFSLYETLFECLKDDNAFYARANSLRHPLIFYYGHTAVFFINKLNVAKFIDTRIDATLESTLAIGVDEMSWDDLNENNYDWPTPKKVKAYRDKVRTLVDHFIRSCEITLPIKQTDPLWVIMMGIEHERIHLETSAVLVRELPLDQLRPHRFWSKICQSSGIAPENDLLPVSGGKLTLGKGQSNKHFGWDNEYGSYETKVEDFKASKYLVSNQEYFDFVKDNGYARENFWTEEGWKWVSYRKAEAPVYWVKHSGEYKYRTMLEVIPMPWDWPVDINYLEAKAFCNWKSKKTGRSIRLPTEAEWYQLRALEPKDQSTWNSAPGNINLEQDMSPCPVNKNEFAQGFFDIIGNVWQWTETAIDGYEGFAVHPIYDDFSTPTFDGKHNVFKGGCWISTGNYALKDSRYAFRRHFFQYSGLRYVEAPELPTTEVNMYETDDIVAQYIEFHYGEEYFNVPNFPVVCAKICIENTKQARRERALDLGCATGRASFELAKTYDHVDAIDFSARLIQAPSALQQKGTQRYTIHDEGELVSYKEISLDDFDGYTHIKNKIDFMQGDACNLPSKYKDYDLVFAGNLIDRLYDPKKFITSIKDRIRSGGYLILTSPYTWLEEFTERNNWLGGFKANTGENYTTLDGLGDALAPEFELASQPVDVPFVIRETKRKYQHTLAELSIWKKIS
ncbi:5-histidylcysteine sulfoxide synthase [Kiloniella majae]|uniref:5-histidylcysteine sulfoxide synthase n=1 Tax=Kiloniella majae TaxID=1938558 RepID=UPI000A278C25|nr:5-histidylcysteine sulfoxide synthase [Kiloniella majae]